MQKLPTSIKKTRGTHRPDRGRENEPELDVEEPPMPDDLTSTEKAEWMVQVPILKAMGVLTAADGIALKQLVQVKCEVDELHQLIAPNRVTEVISTQKEKVMRVHPLYPMLLQLRRDLRQLWTCFGLDPLARTSVHTVKGGHSNKNPAPRAPAGKNDGSGNEGAAKSRAGSYFN